MSPVDAIKSGSSNDSGRCQPPHVSSQAAKPAIIRDLQRGELVLQNVDQVEFLGRVHIPMSPWLVQHLNINTMSAPLVTGKTQGGKPGKPSQNSGDLKAHCLSKKREGSHMSLAFRVPTLQKLYQSRRFKVWSGLRMFQIWDAQNRPKSGGLFWTLHPFHVDDL